MVHTGAIHQIQSLIETDTKKSMNILDHHLQLLLNSGEISLEGDAADRQRPIPFSSAVSRARSQKLARKMKYILCEPTASRLIFGSYCTA